MKKIALVALAALAVVGTANAAAFNWQFKTKAADNGKDVYLVLSSSLPADTLVKDDLLNGKYGTIVDNGTIAKKGGGTTASYQATGSAEDNAITSSSASFFYVVVNGDQYWMSGLQDASAAVYEPPASGTTTSSLSQSAALTYKDFKAVPEPCTVALLALGLAAVGLKRKVA